MGKHLVGSDLAILLISVGMNRIVHMYEHHAKTLLGPPMKAFSSGRMSLGSPFELRYPSRKEKQKSPIYSGPGPSRPIFDRIPMDTHHEADESLLSSLHAFSFESAGKAGNAFLPRADPPLPPSNPLAQPLIVIDERDETTPPEQEYSIPRQRPKKATPASLRLKGHQHSRSLQLDPIQELEIGLKAPAEVISPRTAKSSPNSPVKPHFSLVHDDVSQI